MREACVPSYQQAAYVTAKRIGIAVVEHAGHYLIGLRGPDVPLAGYSEFPGGKCQESESAEACAVRECLEETGMRVAIERLLLRHVHEYPPALVELHFFLCHPECDISLAGSYLGFRWLHSAQLPFLQFPEANQQLLKLIAREAVGRVPRIF